MVIDKLNKCYYLNIYIIFYLLSDWLSNYYAMLFMLRYVFLYFFILYYDIEPQNSKIEKLNRFTFNPILIQQLRKEAREKIFEEIGRSLIEYQKNCEYEKKVAKE